MEKPNLFLSAVSFPGFVKKDIAALQKKYTVHLFQFHAYPKWQTPFMFLRQLFALLKRLRTTDAYVSEFGGYHSFLPALAAKLTGKPALIIVAGTDCVSFPSIKYGHMRRNCLGRITRWSYRLATHIAAVHKSLLFCEYTYQDRDHRHQGILAFCPGLRTETSEIPYGYEVDFFRNVAAAKTPDSFITVAIGANDPARFQLKGIDLVVWAARRFPHYTFTVVGNELPQQAPLPPNLQTIGVVDAERLRALYSAHEFYLQLSISEGFPNAPCEAMLCECIPIGSPVGALPDIIGDTGFILMQRNRELLAALIEQAVNSDKARLGRAARQRIIELFPLERRERELTALVERLLESSRRS